jgi:hypothetical protein
MKIAILGATSQIAKDLIVAFAKQDRYDLALLALKQEVFFVPNK